MIHRLCLLAFATVTFTATFGDSPDTAKILSSIPAEAAGFVIVPSIEQLDADLQQAISKMELQELAPPAMVSVTAAVGPGAARRPQRRRTGVRQPRKPERFAVMHHGAARAGLKVRLRTPTGFEPADEDEQARPDLINRRAKGLPRDDRNGPLCHGAAACQDHAIPVPPP